MWLRNVTLVMAVFCLMLFSIFALSGLLYEFDTYIWYSIDLFIFGTAYTMAAFFLALLHDELPRGKRLLNWMFLVILIPTSIFSYALWVMAFE